MLTFSVYKKLICQVWWHTLIIPPLRRLRQQDCEFEARLGYVGNSGSAGLYSKTLSKKKIMPEEQGEGGIAKD
jgi:hypothetical protein